MVPGLELATRLVTEFCGGTPSEPEVVGYAGYRAENDRIPGLGGEASDRRQRARGRIADNPRTARLRFVAAHETEVFGSGPPTGTIGYVTKEKTREAPKPGFLSVAVPSWRPDVDGKADLVEEVMRIHGVDRIAPQPFASHDAVSGRILTTLQVRTRAARRALAVRGMMEAVTWSFIAARACAAVQPTTAWS